ncbi:D-2-hydroxyacid dehydrogenase family protein [Shinella yambaruensis]|uniref:2-hydroxyacid dehydrogenase n=1 Tax=Shinella yambaruensis TaxID=415996 RepID=A0ABQ5ZRJ5_9HYPH|nr:D-2-hydroxyacid dehydrogenase family protein [Shinella yambaruensis]MCJ8028964.1 D-2-hydroxyacid dehydrogenase family protein [Shinella yambaruensis]MCU7982020.1 D-2-hydroxyacid dehydrogenase family protein [Shinella yambaruensis]GLR54726.1 2-hydroxyacid dehydrogenase [Shinella yambaruensis]
MLRIAILDDYQDVALTLADWALLGDDYEIVRFGRNLASEDEAAAALAGFDVLCLMRERMPLSAALIERLPALRLIVVTGARVRTIDMEAAVARGITVCHTHAGESAHATPEIAWGLILSLARSIPEEDARIRAGGWQHTVGTVLGGKTLGLVGLGKLGGRMVPIAKAFGMEVIAWSQNLTDARAAEAGARRVDKETLFREADVVSLHLILGERSRHTVSAAELGQMKQGAWLINTARGPLVDEAALIEALRQGRIKAGLDVFDIEPLPADHPLRTMPNTVLTPHLGYVTEGAYAAFYRDTVDNIRAWRDGAPVRVLAAPKTEERT